MRAVAAILALLMGGLPLAAFTGPPPAARGRQHDCCCPSCPGPGLCPCDQARGGEKACRKATGDLPSSLETPAVPTTLKLACELPRFPAVAVSVEQGAALESLPETSIPAHPPEKVPIS